MTVRPIIFSGPMVRALLEGRKTQTRRLAWRDAEHGAGVPVATIWQRVKPGDLLWVRESLQRFNRTPPTAQYAATITAVVAERYVGPRHINGAVQWLWNRPVRSSIHMPRWASRLTLEVQNVRVHRLREITCLDARAEGFEPIDGGVGGDEWHAFLDYWNLLHGDRSTDASPTVVALNFTVHKLNIDDFLRQRECPRPAGPDAGTKEKGESGSRKSNTAVKTEDGRGGKQPAPIPR